ncbi:LytR family transcriptional regulator [Bacillus carboniphilus]|uniref:Polyisoprenyl-teichoic acid--peptidoglycan teichoic acid transferase TagU n=1 Tax=Bacillus carboniphilus TaxID=86663 RepID=A0ABY9JV38_9BACI|nr:LytR family transcriptional regulator [Bacillus carboniphilus]WLR41510.1 LytR family transcriptional regulator [Bacillus carboniphilus]
MGRAEKTIKKKRKWLWITLSVVGVLLLSTAGYAYSVWSTAAKTADSIHEELNREKSDKRDEEVDFENLDPISILLMGVDEREGDNGRTDSLILITANPKKESIEMVSIQRDTKTEIIGKGIEDKINHAYAFGGAEMTINTVENFLDIPVDYFVKVNMESFKDIVDSVGGVTVENSFAFDYEGESFPKGTIELNGEEALKYSRMRYDDPNGDYGRQERQRQIIEAVIQKGASISSLTKFGDMFAVVEDNVKTNLSFDDMWKIQSNYRSTIGDIETHELRGTGDKINGIWYNIVSEEDRLELSNMLKEHLEISTSTASQ